MDKGLFGTSFRSTLKLRFELMGVIISIIALIVIGVKGVEGTYAGAIVMLVIGLALLVVGFLWKKEPKKE
jgi:phosphate starvation-inducible membrane PsiE